MTVCVAAISRWDYPDGLKGSAVVLASDRMMTSADTEYEPPKRKIGNLTERSLIMVSGDFTVHFQLVLMASEKIKSRGLTRISDLAEAYAESFREYKAKQASAVFLEPIGLSLDAFISRQSEMNGDLVFRLYDSIVNYPVDAEAIIAGYDTAAHISMVDQAGLVTCHGEIGFAAIGAGYSHAKLQFMAGKYASWWPFFYTLVLTYAAKRAAEVAPGGGSQTDMYLVTRDLADAIPPAYLDFVKRRYDEYGSIKDKFFNDTVSALLSARLDMEESNNPGSGLGGAISPEASLSIETSDALETMVQESGKPEREDGHAEGPARAEAPDRR